jgi:hypothetical protein
MAKRIRRGLLTVGSSVPNLANLDWNDSHEFDRSKGDEEFSGKPVEMSRSGSGSFELLAGHIATGYAATAVFVYKEVDINETTGVETVVSKTATFTDVTINQGGNVPAEGRGSRRFAFEYATCAVT